MIQHLDNLLRHLLMSSVTELADETQVRFDPPDDDWRRYVSTLGELALNVYLLDLRQNRSLRSNEPAHELIGGELHRTVAPSRVDLHYLITAWSPAKPSPAVEPTDDEHRLLYAAAAALIGAEPLVPAKVYQPEPLPNGFPTLIAEAALPTTVLPADGFPKYAEFWGTMAGTHPWRPALYLTVTVPVAVTGTEPVGPLVTARITTIGEDAPLVQIGGVVVDHTGQPVARAWVRIETLGGTTLHVARTDANGGYTFTRLPEATYRLRARAVGFAEATEEIDVPGTGRYDISLSLPNR
ncbi:Pvc16 family protein [Actinocrispum sp. NPDC049592]|uniref:Pvc16 family protein n=1 Tax=Actinocrispum sp. NPDC049592 TaxID=3154835 RepID=UPI00342E7AED